MPVVFVSYQNYGRAAHILHVGVGFTRGLCFTADVSTTRLSRLVSLLDADEAPSTSSLVQSNGSISGLDVTRVTRPLTEKQRCFD